MLPIAAVLLMAALALFVAPAAWSSELPRPQNIESSWTIIKEPEPWTLINEPVDVPYENLGKFGSPSIDSWTKVERDIHAIGERLGPVLDATKRERPAAAAA